MHVMNVQWSKDGSGLVGLYNSDEYMSRKINTSGSACMPACCMSCAMFCSVKTVYIGV